MLPLWVLQRFIDKAKALVKEMAKNRWPVKEWENRSSKYEPTIGTQLCWAEDVHANRGGEHDYYYIAYGDTLNLEK